VIPLRYDPYGRVNDAKGLPDSNALMGKFLEVEETRNVDRMGAGNPRRDILRWVVAPAYRPALRTLHWAFEARGAWWDGKEFLHDRSYLDYHVRILGRAGIMRLVARLPANRSEELKAAMAPLLIAVAFQPGYRYSDFDPSVDKVADMEMTGLITGRPPETPEYMNTLKWIVLGIVALGALRGAVKARSGRDASSDPRAGSG
jgi:uncharacterized membrane-anchored protein